MRLSDRCPLLTHTGFTPFAESSSMGLLDFLFRPPTIDQFAQMFMKEMRRAGATEELKFDKENGRIVRGSGPDTASVNLLNFYKEFLSLPRQKRRKHVADRARVMTAFPDELPDDFEAARPHLRPKVWPRAGLAMSRIQSQIDGGTKGIDIPEYEVGSHLIASLVYDLPLSMRSLSGTDLEKWGITYYEALEIARDNLLETVGKFGQVSEGCYVSMTGDSYDASRLLVPSVIERFEVKGDPVAMIPNRDTLLITGTDDEQGLKIMLDLTKQAMGQTRPYVNIPIRLDDGDWVDWTPPSDHPLFGDFRELALQYLAQQYADQEQLLNQLHQKDGLDIFVASYTLIQKAGRLLSYGSWARDVDTLLPKADYVIFGSTDEGISAIASWEKAQQVAGHLMKPTDLYPERVRMFSLRQDATGEGPFFPERQ